MVRRIVPVRLVETTVVLTYYYIDHREVDLPGLVGHGAKIRAHDVFPIEMGHLTSICRR